jgi:hypothetical protein
MFIGMNRFRVAKGSEAAFEHVWPSRDSHLDKVPGFVGFHLLKGLESERHTLYASHTWQQQIQIGASLLVIGSAVASAGSRSIPPWRDSMITLRPTT